MKKKSEEDQRSRPLSRPKLRVSSSERPNFRVSWKRPEKNQKSLRSPSKKSRRRRRKKEQKLKELELENQEKQLNDGPSLREIGDKRPERKKRRKVKPVNRAATAYKKAV